MRSCKIFMKIFGCVNWAEKICLKDIRIFSQGGLTKEFIVFYLLWEFCPWKIFWKWKANSSIDNGPQNGFEIMFM